MNFYYNTDVCAKTKKRCFTKKQAKKVGEHLSYKLEHNVEYYQCPYCYDYHLTKRSKNEY